MQENVCIKRTLKCNRIYILKIAIAIIIINMLETLYDGLEENSRSQFLANSVLMPISNRNTISMLAIRTYIYISIRKQGDKIKILFFYSLHTGIFAKKSLNLTMFICIKLLYSVKRYLFLRFGLYRILPDTFLRLHQSYQNSISLYSS